ncbi:hypothetical protein LLH03_03395 [bacterium]|nr:hypothetical protein [bacterium]
MGWETRNGKGSYYTRSRRVKGKVVREYVGTGEAAQVAAVNDARDRAKRLENARAFEAARARFEVVEAMTQVFSAVCDTVAQAALVAAGYHRHNRGEWRRRRDG